MNTETLERSCRRSGWRRGRSVVLCDGSQWWLPCLEPRHAPKLRKLAQHVRSVADGTSSLYSTDDAVGHMAGLVGEVLAIHYKIPRKDLRRLLTPTDRIGTDRLEVAVAVVLQQARDARLIREFLMPANVEQGR